MVRPFATRQLGSVVSLPFPRERSRRAGAAGVEDSNQSVKERYMLSPFYCF
jgi:hypothetical protein